MGGFNGMIYQRWLQKTCSELKLNKISHLCDLPFLRKAEPMALFAVSQATFLLALLSWRTYQSEGKKLKER